MKLWFVAAMTLAVSSASALAQPAGRPGMRGNPPVPSSGKSADSAKTAAAEEPKIEGLAIPRANGTFLGLQVVRNNFVISFYDKDKKKMAADVVRASARWPVRYQPNDERTILNRAPDGMTLTSAKVVRPPLLFKLYLAFFVDGKEDPVENFVVDYRGE